MINTEHLQVIIIPDPNINLNPKTRAHRIAMAPKKLDYNGTTPYTCYI